MFKPIISIFISIMMLINPQFLQVLDFGRMPDKSKQIDMSKFVEVWRDDFNGTELDSSKWGSSWWVTERKGGYWHEDMVRVENGNLIISAQYFDEPLENRYYDEWHDEIDFDEYKAGWYTADVTTQGKYEQTYGYFEVRCILPAATGLWSAFWMMNGQVVNVDGSGRDGTEVDVFESMYYKDNWWGNDGVISGIVYDGYGPEMQNASIGKVFIENNP